MVLGNITALREASEIRLQTYVNVADAFNMADNGCDYMVFITSYFHLSCKQVIS